MTILFCNIWLMMFMSTQSPEIITNWSDIEQGLAEVEFRTFTHEEFLQADVYRRIILNADSSTLIEMMRQPSWLVQVAAFDAATHRFGETALVNAAVSIAFRATHPGMMAYSPVYDFLRDPSRAGAALDTIQALSDHLKTPLPLRARGGG